ncbi:YgjP-like metallopeptidase domain-containing protein [Mycoplasmopsis columbinasalis]|uniref:Protein of uncharacterized function DUF45 n=1 Tax=Mycoplasmopsis columbinasalis TaxID=114880 RepID=A0A449B9U6_9BACT|nr:YgjP-like metallopeptidase domain-containing protein [Mycoplasmopsis columbinasalis]VEU77953.1 Protein of uncharacterised function DUF45 [Mycoplasmopsis columbinasalis]
MSFTKFKQTYVSFLDGDEIILFTKKIQVKWEKLAIKKSKKSLYELNTTCETPYVKLFVPENIELTVDVRKKYVSDFYKTVLTACIEPIQRKYEKLFGLPMGDFIVTKKYSTWGTWISNLVSLRPKTSDWKISYSLSLVLLNQKYIETVVVHELTHCFFDKHNKEFMQKTQEVLPDFMEREFELNHICAEIN